MSNIRLPKAVCSVVAELFNDSHESLNARFKAAGAPGDPPNLSHSTKWKTWLLMAGDDPEVDSLAVLGNLIEEFMDVPPLPTEGALDIFGIHLDPVGDYNKRKARLINILEEHGFRYFRGGRIIPIGTPEPIGSPITTKQKKEGIIPSSIEELLKVIIHGLPRAMYPLTNRRKGAVSLSFNTEYDIQDLLHSLLRPWVADIRSEEHVPSYAGSNTRMDFLLPNHQLVIETKRVRHKAHSSKIGDELIIDIEHYRKHPNAEHLWCVIYDPELYIANPSGLISDLEGLRKTPEGSINVKLFIVKAGT